MASTPARTSKAWGKYDWATAAIAVMFLTITARTITSFDSFLYLSSARSIGRSGFNEYYHWIREPGYPLLLKAVHLLVGTADIWLIAVQSLAVVGAASLLFAVAFPDNAFLRRIGLVVSVANPIVIGFVGWIGQQVWFLAIVCGVAAIALATVRNVTWRTRTTLLFTALVGASAGLFSVLLGPMIAATSLGLLGVFVYRVRHQSDNARHALVVGATLSAAFGLALFGWWGVKAAVFDPAEALYGDPAWVWEHAGSPDAQETTSQLVNKIRSVAALGPDHTTVPSDQSPDNWAFQLRVFGGIAEPFSERCGYVFPGPPAAEQYAAGYFVNSCRSAWTHVWMSATGSLGLLIYRVALLAVLISPIVSVFHRPSWILAVLSAGLLFPYLISSGGGISRYALPLYPIGVLLVLEWITSARVHLKERTL